MNKSLWSSIRFADMFKHSPRSAFEFRRNTLWDPIPEQYLTDKEKGVKEEVAEQDMSRDDMKKLLTDSGVEFKGNISNDKLKEIILENNLI